MGKVTIPHPPENTKSTVNPVLATLFTFEVLDSNFVSP